MHEYRIQIILAVLLVFLLYKLLRSVLKKKLEIKYVLSWIIVDFCLLIIDLFPSILTFLCKCLGIQLASNMIFLVAIILGEVLKWLKSLASNTSRPVTRREGSNPSFSAEKGNAKTIFVVHSLFYFSQTDLPHHTPEPETNLQASALLPFGYPASSVHTTAPCAEMCLIFRQALSASYRNFSSFSAGY